MADSILYEKLISEKEGDYQVKLVISEFRGTTYLSLRKYFLSFDDGFVPSKEGISIPFEMESSFKLLDGMVDICSDAESVKAIEMRITKESLENTQDEEYNG